MIDELGEMIAAAPQLERWYAAESSRRSFVETTPSLG